MVEKLVYLGVRQECGEATEGRWGEKQMCSETYSSNDT